jgi:hypothetical protein
MDCDRMLCIRYTFSALVEISHWRDADDGGGIDGVLAVTWKTGYCFGRGIVTGPVAQLLAPALPKPLCEGRLWAKRFSIQ